MSRKDYIKFASMFRGLRELHCDPHVEWVQKAVASIFFEDNPRFDRQRFLEACNPQEET